MYIYIYIYIWGHAERPHPQKSDLIISLSLKCSELSSVLCGFSK